MVLAANDFKVAIINAFKEKYIYIQISKGKYGHNEITERILGEEWKLLEKENSITEINIQWMVLTVDYG